MPTTPWTMRCGMLPTMTQDDLADHARAIVDANLYLTLGTVGADGRPWTAPVYFAPAGDREFVWVSRTDARHSTHLAERPDVSLVVFDSTVAPYHGRAVYALGRAREDDEVDHALAVYPRPGSGASTVSRDDVTGASPYRFYRATAAELWVLCPREPGQPCPRHGDATDHRAAVPA
jgi:nitroimidazol reductase NimA-like FMN-containing flavoprotein (pyridoxamine 5'-phosphate oxidase superfamily)